MDCRKHFAWALLFTGLIGPGCNSSTEQSYELVETPKTAPVDAGQSAGDVARLPAETAKLLAAQSADAMAASDSESAGTTVADVTQLNEPPTADPTVRAAEIEKALAQGPSPPAAIQIAAMAAREGVQTPAPPLLQPPGTDAIANLVPNKIELKVPHKEFSREGRERAWRVTFDDIDLLKILNMEPVPLNAEEYLPEWLTKLDGEKIRLRGWMYPPLMTEGLPAFLFVRDNQICCFGREAKVYDKLRVTMKEGTSTDYIFGRPFDVIGTFRIESEERDGELYFLYSIDDAVVMK